MKHKIYVNTKALKAVIIVEYEDFENFKTKFAEICKLTGGKVYVCQQCESVHITDEPMKEVYFARCDEMKYVCEKCCADMGIFDVEVLQHDFKRHNAKYVAFD